MHCMKINKYRKLSFVEKKDTDLTVYKSNITKYVYYKWTDYNLNIPFLGPTGQVCGEDFTKLNIIYPYRSGSFPCKSRVWISNYIKLFWVSWIQWFHLSPTEIRALNDNCITLKYVGVFHYPRPMHWFYLVKLASKILAFRSENRHLNTMPVQVQVRCINIWFAK